MTRSLRPWKDAATLIIAARKTGTDGAASVTPTQPKSCDYQILMMKRQQKSSSFAGKHVFPGGVIDNCDFSKKWLDVFRHVGVTGAHDFQLPDLVGKPRPWSLTAERDEESLPNDVAFRIGAVRETFEESGILLVTDQAAEPSSPHTPASPGFCDDVDFLRDWQKRVHEDGSAFIDLCSELKAVPDIWSLKEFYHILTPQFFERRYSTMFYLCTMESTPPINIDDVEMIQTQWSSPHEILARSANGTFNLDPPQIILASMLLNFPALRGLGDFASQRELQGLGTSMPVIYMCQDGSITTQPGDDLYPSVPSYEFDTSPNILEETVEQAKNRCQNRFRLRFPSGPSDVNVDCNIQLACGLPSPVQYQQE